MSAPSDASRVIAQRQNKFRLLTVAELLALPPPQWLIHGVIECGALGAVYGPSGDGKTFLMIDWALSIACGREWMGRAVRKGPVVYVIGEGGRNVAKRVAAWLRDRQVEQVDDGRFILEAVQLLTEDDVELLLTQMKTLPNPPVLIIFDTLARCFVEGDENAARDMNRLVEASRKIQAETEATVVFVHHTGKKEKEIERGSNALRGGCDAMVLQRMEANGRITLSNTKQKDHEEFKPIHLRLKTVALEPNETGEEVTSCVLEPQQASAVGQQSLDGRITQALSALVSFPDATATSSAWRKAVQQTSATGIPQRTFQNWRRRLVELGFVEKRSDARHAYRVTDAGRTAIGR